MIIKIRTIKILVIAFMFVAAFDLHAQDGTSASDGSSASNDTGSVGEFAIGAKVLGLASRFQEGKTGMGYGAGAFATYKPLDFLTIQLEALYVTNAGRLDDYSTTTSLFDSTDYSKRTLRFHTIEIPLLVRYGLPFDLFGMSTNVYVGGSYAYNFGVNLVQDKTHYTHNGNEVIENDFKNSRVNVTSNYAPFNLEAIIGFGVNLDLFGMPSHIDLRYKQGFQNQSRLNTIPIEGGVSDFKSRIISLNLGVSLYKF